MARGMTKQRMAKILCGMIIGLPEFEAKETVEHAKCYFRVTHRDGKADVVTRDYKLDRVNVRLVNGYVTETEVG